MKLKNMLAFRLGLSLCAYWETLEARTKKVFCDEEKNKGFESWEIVVRSRQSDENENLLWCKLQALKMHQLTVTLNNFEIQIQLITQ